MNINFEAMKKFCLHGRDATDQDGNVIGRGFYQGEWQRAGIAKESLKKAEKQGWLKKEFQTVQHWEGGKILHTERMAFYYMPSGFLNVQTETEQNNKGTKRQLADNSQASDTGANKEMHNSGDGVVDINSGRQPSVGKSPTQRND